MHYRQLRLHIPGFEIDAWIYYDVHQIADEIEQQTEQGEEKQRSKHHWVVSVQCSLKPEQSQPVEREYDLDQQRAGEQHTDERAGEAGDDDEHRIAKHVTVQHPTLGGAFSARSDYVMFVYLIEKGVLGEHSQTGKAANDHGNNRKSYVPEIVEYALRPRQLAPVFGSQTAQREPVEKTAAGKQRRRKQ